MAEVAHISEALSTIRSGALPAISAEAMVNALEKYRELQAALDKAMPDQIMNLDGKPFRKKGYWRAIALAFNLQVDKIEENRIASEKFMDGRDNFGWTATYRARHPSGREMSGDGACFAIEKARRFKCPHPDPAQPNNPRRTQHFPHASCPNFDPEFQWKSLPADATEHNVRSHANTRAFNRAVSNLVGFGEVSAEEVTRDEERQEDPAAAKSAGGGATAAAAQSSPAAAGVTTVSAVSIKTGGGGDTGRRAWTRWDVSFADGRRGNTFSKTDGEHAVNAKATRALVRPRLIPGDKGVDLAGFDPLDGAPASTTQTTQPAAADRQTRTPHHVSDEPVTGPENILIVRKVTTDAGIRWVVQTDKRELVTEVEQFATMAVACRQQKIPATPSFTIVESADKTRRVARLTALVPATPLAGETAAASAPAETKAEKPKAEKPARASRRKTREPGEEG